MSDNNEVAEALAMSRDELDQLQHRRFRSVVLNLDHATSHEGEKDLTLVDLLEVTVSRISQLRSEALLMLQEGIDAQYADEPSDLFGGSGRVARRKATFAEGIATASAFADRMEEINLIESDASALTARMT